MHVPNEQTSAQEQPAAVDVFAPQPATPAPAPAATPTAAPAKRGRRKAATPTPEPTPTSEPVTTDPAWAPGMLKEEANDEAPAIPEGNIEKFLTESGVPGGIDKRASSSFITESPSDLAAAPDENDGPGWYLCLHGCIGSREFKPRQRYYFHKNPAKTHFVKVADEFGENDG